MIDGCVLTADCVLRWLDIHHPDLKPSHFLWAVWHMGRMPAECETGTTPLGGVSVMV